MCAFSAIYCCVVRAELKRNEWQLTRHRRRLPLRTASCPRTGDRNPCQTVSRPGAEGVRALACSSGRAQLLATLVLVLALLEPLMGRKCFPRLSTANPQTIPEVLLGLDIPILRRRAGVDPHPAPQQHTPSEHICFFPLSFVRARYSVAIPFFFVIVLAICMARPEGLGRWCGHLCRVLTAALGYGVWEMGRGCMWLGNW